MILLAALALAASIDQYRDAVRLFEQQRYTESAQAVESALAADPKLVDGWILKGRLALVLGRRDVSVACFTRAAEIDPKFENARFMLGFVHYLENDFNKALPELEAARQLKSDDARVLFYLAMTYEGLARSDDALRYYEQATAAESTQGRVSPDTLVAYGRLLFSLGRFSDAEQKIRAALAIEQSRDAHYELGRLRLQARDYPGAIAEGELAAALKSVGTTDRQVFFLLAQAYQKAGMAAKAEEYRKRFEASAPSLRR